MERFYFSSVDEGEKVIAELRRSMTTNADYDGWAVASWGKGTLVRTSVGRIARLIRVISAKHGVQLTEGDDIPKSNFWGMLYPDGI